jgi:hypothetical protein
MASVFIRSLGGGLVGCSFGGKNFFVESFEGDWWQGSNTTLHIV